ncbi:site-specific integrase [Ralstonia solanacearum]|uniref:site-specific integrase n=1 Tax=Ralstonia solanacearum TaxID=305 RepID=UPI001FFA7D9D|nr:site-specific integrase [Ralstonia solanacearum]MDB0528265.1 site-specific integrase [Ralstonia solanacearum]
MAHITRRANGVYYFRRRIPLDLIDAHEGRSEVVYSLGTKERADAERAARKASVQLDEAWDAMRKAMQPKGIPTSYDLVEVSGKFIAVPPPPGGWPKQDTAPLTPQQESQQAADEEEAAEQARQEEWAEQEADEQAARLIQALRRAGVTLPVATLQAAAPLGVSHSNQIAQPASKAAPAVNLESLVPHWEKLKKPNAKTVHSAMRAVAEFKDPDVRAVTRGMVIEYRDRLLNEGKAVNTINTRLSFIRILLGIAKDRGLVDVNHAEGTQVAPDKRAVEARIPYSPEQVEAVLSATEQYKDSHPARYWLPRLAKWTGGRLNELHQLRRSDSQARDGIPGILITDAGEHAPGIPMKLKNSGSRRWIPLHPELSAFWTWAQAQSDGPLFPAKPNKFGIVSDAFSKWYGRLLREAAKIKDKRVTFHSWRHGFADKCRAAAVSQEVRMSLMGHAEGGAAGTYGAGHGLQPRLLAEAIQKLGATRT